MGYVVTTTSQAYRMLRKQPPPVRKHLINQAKKLTKDPRAGEQLEGVLRPFRSLHTTYKGTHYRIVYEANTKLKEIIVRGVGPRENIYKKLQRMKLKPLS